MRFFVAIFILNVLPIILLLILYRYIPDGTDWTIIVAAASASLSVFGFHRILHAFIASDKTYHLFYTKKEIDTIRSNSGFEQPQTMIAHLVPGIAYLLIFNLLAWFLVAIS